MTRTSLEHSGPVLVDDHDLVILDLDGVVYVGAEAVAGAAASIDAARSRGVRCSFATNNASRTPEEVAAHLRSLGVPAAPEDVVTSSQAAAQMVLERCGAGARVLGVGGAGVTQACRDVGLEPVASSGDDPVAVIQGYGRDVGWPQLAEAAYAIQRGAWWVATNTDATIPTERGPAPGNGSLVAAVRAAVDVDPVVAGKPEPALFTTAAGRAGARRPLVVGDRLDTDLAGAVRAGQPGLLVLTGVSRPLDVLRAEPHLRPSYVAVDLSGLLTAHAAPTRDGDTWRCGRAHARLVDGVLDGGAPDDEDGSLDLLRAACSSVWSDGARSSHPTVAPAVLHRWERLGRGEGVGVGTGL